MSDDITYEQRRKLTENILGDADWAADEILALRTRVAELEAEMSTMHRSVVHDCCVELQSLRQIESAVHD